MQAVFFDFGETLFDEIRQWNAWADLLGVARPLFFALLGATIARGEHHRRVFELAAPGVDMQALAPRLGFQFGAQDLYPDVRPALARLRAAGLRLGVAGNQPASSEALLHALGLGLEVCLSSASLGAAKPDPSFFTRLCERVRVMPGQALYVGDRLDLDVRPARAAGLRTAHLRRGPWGHLHATEAAREADLCLDSLLDLPAALGL